MISKHSELTARSLATLGFRDIVEKSELRFVAGNRTDIVNGARVRVMLNGHDIWVKVPDKSPDAFEAFAFGDIVSLVEPEAVIYTRDGDRWPRVSFRSADIVKVDARDEEV